MILPPSTAPPSHCTPLTQAHVDNDGMKQAISMMITISIIVIIIIITIITSITIITIITLIIII